MIPNIGLLILIMNPEEYTYIYVVIGIRNIKKFHWGIHRGKEIVSSYLATLNILRLDKLKLLCFKTL